MAIQDYRRNPSEATKAALEHEFMLNQHHQKMLGIVLPLSVLVFDIVVVYFFWNYGTRKTIA